MNCNKTLGKFNINKIEVKFNHLFCVIPEAFGVSTT